MDDLGENRRRQGPRAVAGGLGEGVHAQGVPGVEGKLGLAQQHESLQLWIAGFVELVRVMLRDNGAWCRLETDDLFFIHVGFDQYVYVGSVSPCPRAVQRATDLGLFTEPLDASPYAFEEETTPVRCADDTFWVELRAAVARQGALLLEEVPVGNLSRWHRLTTADIDEGVDKIRARLAPRAGLLVWPDLTTDLAAVMAAVPDGLAEVVWQDHSGHLASATISDADPGKIAQLLHRATAATVLPLNLDQYRPLLTGVPPDLDGVLRARWRPD